MGEKLSAGVDVLEVLWGSNNARWTILLVRTVDSGSDGKPPMVRTRVMVENVPTGETHWPINYWDGRVGWDNPYVIPGYVSRKTEEIIRKNRHRLT